MHIVNMNSGVRVINMNRNPVGGSTLAKMSWGPLIIQDISAPCKRRVLALFNAPDRAGHSLYLPGGSTPQYGRHICPPQPGLELTTTGSDGRGSNHLAME